MTERPATRLHVTAGLAPSAAVALDREAAHRLQHVLRLGPGTGITVFNAQDGEWLARIERLDRGGGELTVLERRRAPAPEPDLWLLFAPIRRVRLDWLVEKASELGVGVLVPVWTAHTQMERLNRERLAALALAAAEQSGRLSVPAVRPPERLDRVLAGWPDGRRLLVCDETGGGAPIATALAGFPVGGPTALLVGPEGGFAERELDALGKLSIVTRVGLGPRILRAETAAIAALCVFQAIAGDWRQTRPR